MLYTTDLYVHWLATYTVLFEAVLIGGSLGLLIGAGTRVSMCVEWGVYRALILPFVGTPGILLLPIILAHVGFGNQQPQLILASWSCLIIVSSATREALKNMPQELVRMTRVMGAGPYRTLWEVGWPYVYSYLHAQKAAIYQKVLPAIIAIEMVTGQGYGIGAIARNIVFVEMDIAGGLAITLLMVIQHVMLFSIVPVLYATLLSWRRTASSRLYAAPNA
jgi:ABC-type nitrate/sulfonate/bicarbonate transport system permease component